MPSDNKNVDQLGILTKANHDFANHLYKVLASDEENILFSPLSIHIALMLTYIGAEGETAAELKTHLHLPDNKDDLLNEIGQLLSVLENPKLNVATEIFIENSCIVKSEYKENARKYFNSQSTNVDFRKSARQVEKLINDWVSSQTNNKINNVIPRGTFNEDTRLVLVNAIHFKDLWEKPFENYNSSKEKFYTTENNFFEIDMMRQTSSFSFLKTDQFRALELPYEDRNFKMVIFLPNEISGLSNLEKTLFDIDLTETLRKMRTVEVKVTLPKFKFEKTIDLKIVLEKMGIQTMFDGGKADFSGMCKPTEGSLFISDVLHKAFVEVNEEGTEAAASTVMAFSKRCRTRVHQFTANHPFLFHLLFKSNLIFSGKFSSI